MLETKQCLILAATAAGALIALPSVAAAQADFYKGKTVTYIVATAPGGGYDTYGRLVAEFMQRNLPGSTFVVKNVPGAGHIIGANAINASKPDGLTIGTFNTGLIYNQLVGLDGVKFDLTKMSWVGKAASDPRTFVISASSPIKTFDDLLSQKEQVNFSTAGVGSAAYVETKMLTDALRLPIKIITGYNGNDDQMAMRRGEITGVIGSRSSYEDFVKNGYGRFVAQIGGKDASLPQVSSAAKDPAAKSLVALIQSQGDISRLTAGPPAIPAAQMETLRAAYKKAMDDPELQAKASKSDRPVDPAIGEDVAKMVREALNQTPQTIALLKDALNAKPSDAKSTALKATGPIDVQEKGRKVTFNGPDGKPVAAEPSGSRTKITVAGKEATREDLKTGLNCEITYEPGAKEPTSIACQ
jgi:tripartite-type tricarboxylate transporter receptor subunit TctC